MADIDPFRDPPVYEHDQVVTVSDLFAIRNGFAVQYLETPWFDYWTRYKWRAAIGTVDTILKWIEEGKKE